MVSEVGADFADFGADIYHSGELPNPYILRTFAEFVVEIKKNILNLQS
jgi:hypothetical protein